jgi:hypothetical protein
MYGMDLGHRAALKRTVNMLVLADVQARWPPTERARSGGQPNDSAAAKSPRLDAERAAARSMCAPIPEPD